MIHPRRADLDAWRCLFKGSLRHLRDRRKTSTGQREQEAGIRSRSLAPKKGRIRGLGGLGYDDSLNAESCSWRSVERGARVMASEQVQEDLVEEIVQRFRDILKELAKY